MREMELFASARVRKEDTRAWPHPWLLSRQEEKALSGLIFKSRSFRQAFYLTRLLLIKKVFPGPEGRHVLEVEGIHSTALARALVNRVWNTPVEVFLGEEVYSGIQTLKWRKEGIFRNGKKIIDFSSLDFEKMCLSIEPGAVFSLSITFSDGESLKFLKIKSYKNED